MHNSHVNFSLPCHKIPTNNFSLHFWVLSLVKISMNYYHGFYVTIATEVETKFFSSMQLILKKKLFFTLPTPFAVLMTRKTKSALPIFSSCNKFSI